MKKDVFQSAEMMIIEFKLNDVILTSGEDEYEGDNPYGNGMITSPHLFG